VIAALALGPNVQVRLAKAGVHVEEARLTHLAYAPEIAQAMLRRQQAEAVIAARTKMVHGAVSMVEMALHELSSKKVVHLDVERKAAMVSNLLVGSLWRVRSASGDQYRYAAQLIRLGIFAGLASVEPPSRPSWPPKTANRFSCASIPSS